jgi:hypothetical protein
LREQLAAANEQADADTRVTQLKARNKQLEAELRALRKRKT